MRKKTKISRDKYQGKGYLNYCEKYRKYVEKWKTNPVLNKISEKILYETIRENEKFEESSNRRHKRVRYSRSPSPSSSYSSILSFGDVEEDETLNQVEEDELVIENNITEGIENIEIDDLVEDARPATPEIAEPQSPPPPLPPKKRRKRKPRDPNAEPIKRRKRKPVLEKPEQQQQPPPPPESSEPPEILHEICENLSISQEDFETSTELNEDEEVCYQNRVEEEEDDGEVSEESGESDEDFKECPEVELKKILTLLHRLKTFSTKPKTSKQPLEFCMTSQGTEDGLWLWDLPGALKRALRQALITRNWDVMTELLIFFLNRTRWYFELVKNVCRIMLKFNPKIKEHGLEHDFEVLINHKYTRSLNKTRRAIGVEQK